SEERAQLMSAFATEYALSPDEKWVAWREKFNAYIAPFVSTGKTVEIGPDIKSIPVAKVSKEAGEWLHWAGDASRLYWALGPELFSKDLKDAFAFINPSSRASARDLAGAGGTTSALPAAQVPRAARDDAEHALNHSVSPP